MSSTYDWPSPVTHQRTPGQVKAARVLLFSGSVRRYLAPDRGQPYPVPPQWR